MARVCAKLPVSWSQRNEIAEVKALIEDLEKR